MTYKVITSSQTVRDIEEAVFYKEGVGFYHENILKFKRKIINSIRSLENMPEIGTDLSSRIDEQTNIKYLVVEDCILFYEIEGNNVIILRLLPAKSNWMNTIMKQL